MKVSDIIGAIEEFAPASAQESWDNTGLCIGSPSDEVGEVLLGLDCTPSLVDEAKALGANMIVTHHPLIFKGLRRISGDDPVGEAVMKAVRAGIAVYAAHTSADKVPGGVSWAMAERLSLSGCEVLDPESDGIGLGVVGNLPAPVSGREAVDLVKESFGLTALRSSKPVEGPVKRVAVCGGSGASLIGAAERAGAQLFVTADVSYHNFFTPEGFMVMDIGHFESEVGIVSILFSIIKKKFPNFAVRISDNIRNSNPIYYF